MYVLYTDVERGVAEEGENLQPLLGVNNHNAGTVRMRPSRPNNLGPSDAPRNPARHPHMLQLVMPVETPSSCNTTPANTPVPDTGENWPKKWRRSDRRLRRLNTELLEAIETHDIEEVERLLNSGANPNATCRLDLVSACHMAALAGGEALALLVKFGAEKLRLDKLGRTPLHLAAWAGNARQMAILLDLPEDMQARVENEDMSPEAELDMRKHHQKTKEMANVACDLGEVKMLLPNTWKDNIDHSCRDIQGSLPLLQPGWTPLHVASSCARRHCTRFLLAAGADPNLQDVTGRTPLDVAGSGYYYDVEINSENFTEVIRMLFEAGGKFNTMKLRGLKNLETPLHTAVELECLGAINELLKAGVSIACLNSAGLTPLHVCVKKELEEPLQVLANYAYPDADPFSAMVDVRDAEGHTVLQAAVEVGWVPGVCIALEAGADVIVKAYDGETPIHSAAALGNLDVLNEILSVAKQKDSIDIKSEEGETPLFKAITNGHLECVKAILNEGASIKITLPGDVNVLHVAAECGHFDILKVLFEHDEAATQVMLNALSAGDRRGFGPIHFAVSNNNPDCVKFLLSNRADIRLRTTCSPHKSSTPLHIAAVKNHSEVAQIILEFDKNTIHEVNSMGWFPLHTAGHHGSRDVITLLLKEGANLSGYTDGPKKYRKTAIDLIINNLSKPTEFFEDVFDSYITTNGESYQDPNCVITVDYRVLMPSICEMEQMKVIEALLKTGNRHGQKKLLVHPLLESFLYLKWKALLPFFYTIIGLFAMFVMALTIFIVSVFFYKDTDDTPPVWLDTTIWGYVVYATICLILLQELLYMNVKSSRYFLQLETWVKFSSLGLATILPPAVMIASWSQAEWPRHVATMALLLAWLELMFLLSRFPNWGYYVLMFGKVASNVIKILLTFAFLIIGFSLSFMIQFRSQLPFEGPWAALVKTVVMMTSEFDYGALFDAEHIKELSTSLIVVRIIFVVFLILAAIVLMNLLVGVAVNDINDLEVLGNVRRLAKQVEFLGTLDILVYNRVFSKILPKRINNSIKNKRKVLGTLSLCPGKPRWRHYRAIPSRIRDAIFNKALTQKKQMDDEIGFQIFKNKIDEMYKAIVKKKEVNQEPPDLLKIEDKPFRFKTKYDEVLKHLTDLDDGVANIKGQMATYIQESKSPIDMLNARVDQMSLEIKAIMQVLNRMENKLSR